MAKRKPLLVWLTGPQSTVAHREVPGTVGRTGCGLWTSDTGARKPQAGFWIDWLLLDATKVRLCERCFLGIGKRVIRDMKDMDRLPPCEADHG
jgi:hypothetical protein